METNAGPNAFGEHPLRQDVAVSEAVQDSGCRPCFEGTESGRRAEGSEDSEESEEGQDQDRDRDLLLTKPRGR